MKTIKLVLGIFCCIFCLVILLQSCAVGVGNALLQNGEMSGTAGFLVAMMLLAGGIVMIVTRKSTEKGGSVAGAIIFMLAALIGFANAGNYTDLNIWSGFCVLLGIINISAAISRKKDSME